ncbi:N-acetylmuramoyl-L-alanine amidase [Seinonella peptonophila]|uniref:N-acetylmuramoyl-L-alanine amidase n=1 Tax=Seinonella peptonophila TaxID=112248 RepID=A0A1M4T4X2_9BACL|nr:N-acetylmuramoyl-L-alanine amidase [Seinonella peptonophila]SHE39583.1 N-acetylmuramoyl-L-alanine amidase [Seinonella peptonophila]
MNIIEKLIPMKYKRIRPGTKRTPKYITIHETDNTDKGATASVHANLLYNGNSERVASWHYTVDESSIYQSVPDDEVAWHAGDGSNGTGNHYSIGVEICVNSDGDFTKAKENAAWLVNDLMNKHNISISAVVQHHHWSGKDCPHNIRGEGWDHFVELIKSVGARDSSPPIYDKNADYHRLLKVISPMLQGEDVKRVQKRLQSKQIDGIYGLKTKQDVKDWQRVHDEQGNVAKSGKGLVVDGIVGPKTWKALFR